MMSVAGNATGGTVPGDATVQHVTDHPFEPRGAWYSICRHCRLAEAAHTSTTVAEEDRS